MQSNAMCSWTSTTISLPAYFYNCFLSLIFKRLKRTTLFYSWTIGYSRGASALQNGKEAMNGK